MSKITVVIPTYNQSEYLSDCIDSVLAQNRKPDQIIVVDDRSTDNTTSVIKKYQNKVKYIRHEKNLGPVKTFNDCLRRAKGDYILMVSGDDWLEKNIIETEAGFLDRHPDIAMVFAQSYTVENNKKKLIINQNAGNISYTSRDDEYKKLLISGNYIDYLTAMVRSKVYNKLGYWDEKLPYLHDYEMWIRIGSKYKIAYIAQPLANYRIHRSNLHKKVGRLVSYQDEFSYILRKYLKRSTDIKLKNKAYYYFYISLVIKNFSEHKITNGKKYWVRAIKSMPFFLFKWTTWQPFYFLVREFFIKF